MTTEETLGLIKDLKELVDILKKMVDNQEQQIQLLNVRIGKLEEFITSKGIV